MGNSTVLHLEHLGQINFKNTSVFQTIAHYSLCVQNGGRVKNVVDSSALVLNRYRQHAYMNLWDGTFGLHLVKGDLLNACSIPSSLEHAGLHTSKFIESNYSVLLTFNDMVITSGAMQEVDRVALRCEAPLDAIELENHGYHYGFFERENNVFMETFTTLSQLGIHTLVYFCDVSGPQFDVDKMIKFANRFDIKLCKVQLPFCPCDFTLWDECQWRIFDTRLSMALNKKRSQLHPMKLLNGGLNNAPIH